MLLVPALPAWAAEVAQIDGRVLGPDGRPRPQVDLVLSDERGQSRQSTISDASGGFVFLVSDPGVKRLTVFAEQGAQVAAWLLRVPARGRIQIQVALSPGADRDGARLQLPGEDALPLLWSEQPALVAPARGQDLARALTAVPGTAAPTPPGDGPVLAGTDPAEVELRLAGQSLNDPVEGRAPWELPRVLFAGVTPHLGLGPTVDGDPGRGTVDLQAPGAQRNGVRLLGAGEAVSPAGEVLAEAQPTSRPRGWTGAGFGLASAQGTTSGGRLGGSLTVAPARDGWQADPSSTRAARGRLRSVVPALARVDAQAGRWRLQLTALGAASRERHGRPGPITAAAEPATAGRDLGLLALAARHPVASLGQLDLRAGLLGARVWRRPLAGERLVTRSGRASLEAELHVRAFAGGAHLVRVGAGLSGEGARRQGLDSLRAGEPAVDRSRASSLTAHLAVDERYSPLPWLELEAGLRLLSLRLQGRVRSQPEREVTPSLRLAPRARIAAGTPLPGTRLFAIAGRFAGAVPLHPMLGGAAAPPVGVDIPIEDAGLLGAQWAGRWMRLLLQATERRTRRVIEDRFSPANGRLELFQPRAARRRYRAVMASVLADTPVLHAGLAASWSSLRGNHEGFTDAFTGRARPGGTGLWDTPTPEPNGEGALPFDRRLSIRWQAEHARELRAGHRLVLGVAARFDGGTPLSARARSLEGGEGQSFLVERGSLGRTGTVTSLDAGLALSMPVGPRPGPRMTIALQGANLTNHRPVIAREELYTERPARPVPGGRGPGDLSRVTDGAGGPVPRRPTFLNPVAWAEPLSLRLLLGLEL